MQIQTPNMSPKKSRNRLSEKSTTKRLVEICFKIDFLCIAIFECSHNESLCA